MSFTSFVFFIGLKKSIDQLLTNEIIVGKDIYRDMAYEVLTEGELAR